ncbi:MAG: hypothetical protein QME96_14555 [Myxococcota bacterium]|nr:hypothetical protein [Myxococcota bacterium]
MPSNDALGLRGLLHPFQRDRRSDFVSGTGEALIRATVAQILGTACASEFTPGRIPWRTEMGSLLGLLRHRRNDAVLQRQREAGHAPCRASCFPPGAVRGILAPCWKGPYSRGSIG